MSVLRHELPPALKNLQQGNIAPVDLAQAAIGPGMAVFTRYAKVIESDGSPMTVRTALGIINQALDEVLAEQEGEFDGDTRWALAWFEQFGMDEGPFGDAETLSKAKNTAVNGLVEAGIIIAQRRQGAARQTRRTPRRLEPSHGQAAHRLGNHPAPDPHTRPTWRIGRQPRLFNKLGGMAEISRELGLPALSRRANARNGRRKHMAYNSLVVAWSELTKACAFKQKPPD